MNSCKFDLVAAQDPVWQKAWVGQIETWRAVSCCEDASFTADGSDERLDEQKLYVRDSERRHIWEEA